MFRDDGFVNVCQILERFHYSRLPEALQQAVHLNVAELAHLARMRQIPPPQAGVGLLEVVGPGHQRSEPRRKETLEPQALANAYPIGNLG